MPFALVFIGLILIITGAKDTYAALGKQLVTDFTGSKGFIVWIVAIGAVGSLGYVEKLRPFSRIFMVLIIVSMVIKNGGVFDKLQEAINTGPVAPKTDKTVSSADIVTSGKTDFTAENVLSHTISNATTAMKLLAQ